MSINPQAQGNDMFDVLQGSVSNHFTQIESVLLQNECINGQYNLVSSAAYAANCPVEAPGFTKVCFSTNGSIIADLENSYIEADITYELQYSGWDKSKAQLPAPGDGSVLTASNVVHPVSKYFIGFKQSLDALERYDIYVNSQLLYSQPFVGPESTVLMAGINDTMRENSPFVYTTFNNASTMDNNVCGVYVDLRDVAENTTFKVKIPVKINLHQFLLLSPIHYLPSFAGRWELQLYFGSKNMVICPVNPKTYIKDMSLAEWKKVEIVDANKNPTTIPNHFDHHLDLITHYIEMEGNPGTPIGWANYFTQINCEMPAFTWDVATKKPKFTKMTLKCTKATLNSCLMNTTQFQLKFEVYKSLMEHYMQSPLIIPTNTLSYQRFAHSAGQGDSHIQSTANLPVENLDALFVLIPENDNQQTCYYQPYLTGVRMGFGEFGIRPQRYMATCDTGDNGGDWENRRFITYLLDALNLESSQISAMNKDFSNSILPHPIEYSGTNMSRTRKYTVQNKYDKQYDNSCFMLGFPLSQVGFQSGCVSSPNSNINMQFDADKVAVPAINGAAGKMKEFSGGGIIGMFLNDTALCIQVQPNSDHPIVKLTSKSIV